MIYGYKFTEPGLVCRGYQFKPGPTINRCEAAEVQNCGFHFALNPMDCLSYYGSFDKSEAWYIEASGEFSEKSGDSKMSCTELRFLERLDAVNFVVLSAIYIKEHPHQPLSMHVKLDEGVVDVRARNRFVLVVGRNPRAMGTRKGDILCLVKRNKEGEVTHIWLSILDGKECKIGEWHECPDGAERSLQ